MTRFATCRMLAAALGAALVGATAPALAALAVGAPAPDFTAEAAVGGKTFTFSLSQALQKGPVVLYFYPKSFTKGCTIEAHNFAEAAPKFEAMGASLIGMSADDIGTQKEFSTKECRDKFPVAADAGAKVMKLYDAVLLSHPSFADRISYVIAPDGKVLYVYASMDPDLHVQNTLKAVEDWRAKNKMQGSSSGSSY
jgi:thioredoxin-dependent peroxiredoxin